MTVSRKHLFVGVFSFVAMVLTVCHGRTDGLLANAGFSAENVRLDRRSNPVNIALGKPYVFEPNPNYSHCTDEGDVTQLTDGQYSEGSEGSFWVQKGTVGWQNVPCFTITIDLQKLEPICGLSFNTAAGKSGVEWPISIMILVSEDGKNFNYVGDFINLSRKNDAPVSGQYAVHRYVTHDLATKARYVRLEVVSSIFAFCDEIEVYRGPEALLEQSVSEELVGEDIKTFCCIEYARMRSLLFQDIDVIKHGIQRGKMDVERRRSLENELVRLEHEVNTSRFECVTNPGYRAVAPLNDLHSEILKVNASLLRASGFPSLFAWHKNRWDPLGVVETLKQPPVAPPDLVVAMMNKEYRAEVVNLMNTTKSNLTALLTIEGLPGGRNPEYVVVHQVEFVGTQEGMMIADPLPVAKRIADGWLIDLPSGMTRQVWLTFHPTDVKAGVCKGQIRIRPFEECTTTERIYRMVMAWFKTPRDIAVPLTLNVYPFRFPDRPRLSLLMFDYTDRDKKPYYFKSCTESNMNLAIADMREHFVDTPSGHRSSACWPENGDFDAEGNLVNPLRATGFDKWVNGQWKGSRNYFVYLEVSSNFVGETMGSPRFNKMLRNWASAFAAHAKQRGIDPKQIIFDLVDEPSSSGDYRINTIWGTQIKAGAPEFVLWTDAATHGKKWEKRNPEFEGMLAVHDIFCPHRPQYHGMDEVKQNLLSPSGPVTKRLWFYSCYGPARLFDPYYYHRLQSWQCWRYGAVGMAFWNYWNYYENKPGDTAWNELMTSRESFRENWGVVYTTSDSVTGGKHWEAVREGVEDYEYLGMLRDRIEELRCRGVNTPDVADADRLLTAITDDVVSGYYDMLLASWSVFKDRSAADRARCRILQLLQQLGTVQ